MLLGLVPLYLAWYVYVYEKKRLVISLSYDPTKIVKSNPYLIRLRHLPLLLQLLGLSLLVLALARPQSSREVVERDKEGIDIMLAMDVSGSMEAPDLEPDRLTVAKENATAFVNGRSGDRVGIVLFAEDAFSYAPLTLDYEWITKLIQDIRFGVLPKQGTSIGTATSIAINRLTDSKTPSKIIILFTDGANNRGEIDPLTAARLAKQYDIRIYIIGMGKDSYVKETAAGKLTVKSDLDEFTLQKMTEISHGKYFRADDAAKMKAIFEEIAALEKGKISEDFFRDSTDLYPFYVKLGVLCFLLAFVMMSTVFSNPLEV